MENHEASFFMFVHLAPTCYKFGIESHLLATRL